MTPSEPDSVRSQQLTDLVQLAHPISELVAIVEGLRREGGRPLVLFTRGHLRHALAEFSYAHRVSDASKPEIDMLADDTMAP